MAEDELPQDLAQVLRQLPAIRDPNVLVGTSTSDDAAAYRIDAERSLIQTLEFITPIVDDPYDFGQIAAANSISDVYAMGGRPLFALNIVCFPTVKISMEILAEMLRGGSDKAREAGIDIVGGHSVDDAEPKYGLVVTGVAPVERLLTNSGAQPGDVLVLTKPLGSGLLTTAAKNNQLAPESLRHIVNIMATLNRDAAEALDGLQVHALADVTGFGVLGHLVEIAEGSDPTAIVHRSSVPVLDEVWPLGRHGIYPGGANRNAQRIEPCLQWPDAVSSEMKIVLSDPQTSGWLLIAVASQDVDELPSVFKRKERFQERSSVRSRSDQATH